MGNAVGEVYGAGGCSNFMFFCPGCGERHDMPLNPAEHPRWEWNGSVERPTLTPSLLIRSGHYVPGHEGDDCWCTYNAEHPDAPAPFSCYTCHSYITEGRIQFLADSTHALAGQIVDLPEWTAEGRETAQEQAIERNRRR